MERETVSGPDTEDQTAMPEWRVYAPEFPPKMEWLNVAFLRMVGRVRGHDPQGAAEMARRYLSQFPDGLRRREAEQVLQAPR